MKKLGFFITSLMLMSIMTHANHANVVHTQGVDMPLEKIPDITPIQKAGSEINMGKVGTLNLGDGLTGQINRAIVAKDWQSLDGLLHTYQSSAEYDPILYQYALGAWHRSQFNHHRAIAVYRQMLADNPDFHYVRFDLALMLFEDKRYDEAKSELMAVRPLLNADMQALTERYLDQIDKRNKANTSFNVNYEKTDNVNNASPATQVRWQGKTWKKTAESLPQKATGVRYGFDIAKDKQLRANHYLTANAGIDGVHYWNKPEYDEQTATLGLGYKYQNVRGNVSVVPFLNHTWLDDKPYQYETGIKANINRRISSKLHVGAGVQYAKRYYDEKRLAERYDSDVRRVSASYRYVLTPSLMVFGGVDVTDDDTKDKEFASVRHGINLGVLGEMDNGMGGRVSVRYAKRKFDAPEQLLYGFVRQDDEYYLQTALWYDKWQYKGFVPNLNINYRKISSNMADLYSRDGVQSFISVEKKF